MVIGAGAGGVAAAVEAAALGRSVVVVEQDKVGGVSALWGCIPSKYLLWRLYGERRAPLARLQEEKAGVASRVAEAQYQRLLDAWDVPCLRERAYFRDAQHVVAGDTLVSAEHVLIATGSVPRLPPLPGLEDVPYLTWWSALFLEELPSRLLVLGGGVTATELAQLFAMAGAEVTMVLRGRGLLGAHDPDIAAALARELARDGVQLRTGTRPLAVAQSGSETVLTVLCDGREERLVGDALLLATGMRANVDNLHLEATRVELDDHGYVVTDRSLRSRDPAIFAAGDACGEPLLVPAARREGQLAARNALLGRSQPAASQRFPTAIFTEPQAGTVGEPGPEDVAFTYRLERSARPLLEGRPEGFVKLYVSPDRRLTAVRMVGARAAEVVHLASIAIQDDATVESVAAWPMAHPTFAEVLVDAAQAFLFSERRRPPRRPA